MAGKLGVDPQQPEIEVMAMPTERRVIDNPRPSRYELWLGATRAGLIDYRSKPGVVFLVYTEVDPAFAGQGLGELLVAGALEDLPAGRRTRGTDPSHHHHPRSGGAAAGPRRSGPGHPRGAAG
jgi:uncharacterized protein